MTIRISRHVAAAVKNGIAQNKLQAAVQADLRQKSVQMKNRIELTLAVAATLADTVTLQDSSNGRFAKNEA